MPIRSAPTVQCTRQDNRRSIGMRASPLLSAPGCHLRPIVVNGCIPIGIAPASLPPGDSGARDNTTWCWRLSSYVRCRLPCWRDRYSRVWRPHHISATTHRVITAVRFRVRVVRRTAFARRTGTGPLAPSPIAGEANGIAALGWRQGYLDLDRGRTLILKGGPGVGLPVSNKV